MSPFGPFYPPRLQACVNHAERMARLLLYEESRAHDARHTAAWLVGRASEIERFAETVVECWRSGRRSPETAAAALEGYLAALHEGLATRLGITGPACCRADGIPTVVATPFMGGSAEGLVESIDRLLDNLGGREETTRPPPSPR